MELYSTIKKNEFKSFEAKWIDLDAMILSEISWTWKTTYDIISFKVRNPKHE